MSTHPLEPLPSTLGDPDIPPDISVVIPCLNEAETLGICLRKASEGLARAAIHGEIIVADNGSTDGSKEIAKSFGVRVVEVSEPGYGAALMGGIAAARGRWIIMGDADDSYDFSAIPPLVEALRSGADLVQGCRFPRGGGTILPGAMPPLHRWFGNPILSWLVRRMFDVPVIDVYCGLRGFTRRLYQSLDLRCCGMEFATEMILKAGMQRARITQVPITLYPDGRKAHGPHLRTFRDGWRTLRLFMIYSPRWTFFLPGALTIGIGLTLFLLALPQTRIFGIALDVHSLLVAALAIIVGYQAILFAGLARNYAIGQQMIPAPLKAPFWTMERGLLAGGTIVFLGLGLILSVVAFWARTGFGPLAYPTTMRIVIPGVMFATIGIQTVFASLYLGVLTMLPPRPARSKLPGGCEQDSRMAGSP